MNMSATAIGKRRIQPMDLNKWLGASAGALLAAVPWAVRTLVLVALTLTMLDTVTGVWLAGREKRVSSHTMRDQLAAKSFQFLIIGTLGACGAVVTSMWEPFGASVGLIVAIEAKSNIENLLRLEQTGGAPLGPFRPLVWKLGAVFAVSQPGAEEGGKS